jgi:hypothetical protein
VIMVIFGRRGRAVRTKVESSAGSGGLSTGEPG